MEHENENIIRENLNNLFCSLCGMNSAFALQADELFLLRDGGEDAYTAYEVISTESDRVKDLPYFGTSRWLHVLSEYAYTRLKGSETDEHLFAGFGFSDDDASENLGRVSYLKNKFTVSAFDRFSKHLPDAKSTYSDSFEDSCEDVYNGICDYCILPIGNSRDGTLSVFRNLIAKYDLHICMTVDVPDQSGTVTTLALLSSTLSRPQEDTFSDYRFEFCVGTLTNDSICGILTSAERHGFSLISIASQSISESSPSLQFTFSAKNATYEKFRSFVFCLSAIFPSFTVKGLYKHIN
jgi:hypothetical protein